MEKGYNEGEPLTRDEMRVDRRQVGARGAPSPPGTGGRLARSGDLLKPGSDPKPDMHAEGSDPGFKMSLPKALLFDLGGVVMALDWDRVFSHWAEHSGVDAGEIRRRYAFDPPHTSATSARDRRTRTTPALRNSLGIEIGDEALAEGWGASSRARITPTVRLIEQVKDRVPVYAFSNTNTAHLSACWSRRIRRCARALPQGVRLFAMGLRKPELRHAFEHIAAEIGVRARRHPLLRRHDRERRRRARRGPFARST